MLLFCRMFRIGYVYRLSTSGFRKVCSFAIPFNHVVFFQRGPAHWCCPDLFDRFLIFFLTTEKTSDRPFWIAVTTCWSVELTWKFSCKPYRSKQHAFLVMCLFLSIIQFEHHQNFWSIWDVTDRIFPRNETLTGNPLSVSSWPVHSFIQTCPMQTVLSSEMDEAWFSSPRSSPQRIRRPCLSVEMVQWQHSTGSGRIRSTAWWNKTFTL